MKNILYIKKIHVISAFLVALSLIGCLANVNDQPSSIVPFQTVTESTASTRIITTKILSPSPSPAPTYTATSTFIPTTIPTPPGNTNQDKLKKLDETNGGCALPCLWGIHPGKTRWIDAEPYLRSFVESLSRGSRSPHYSGRIYRTDYPSYMDPNQPLDSLFYVESSGSKNGTIEIIYTFTNHNLTYYLTVLGIPDEVWINLELLSPPQFSIVIYYKVGVLLNYGGFLNDYPDPNFVICPADIPNTNSGLWLWDPTAGKSWQDIGKMSTIIPALSSDHYLRSLDELTDLKMEEFYHMFLDYSGAAGCIKIAPSVWYKNP